jgi:tetratricopeptide (TPR) repeat protein
MASAYYYNAGDYDKALDIFRKRLPDFDAYFGGDYIEIIDLKSWIACSLYNKEKYDEALLLFKETAVGKEKEYGSENDYSMCEYNWLAATLEKTGKKQEALRIFEKLLINCEKNKKMNTYEKYRLCSYFINFLYENKNYKHLLQYAKFCVLISNVIITNKNNIAIALYYDSKIMHAPTITILGKNKVAQNIIDTAKDNNIPVIDNVEQAKDMINEFSPGVYSAGNYLTLASESRNDYTARSSFREVEGIPSTKAW